MGLVTERADAYKFQFRSLADAQKVGNGVPYRDTKAGCWKVRTLLRKHPPYDRAKQKEADRKIIARELSRL